MLRIYLGKVAHRGTVFGAVEDAAGALDAERAVVHQEQSDGDNEAELDAEGGLHRACTKGGGFPSCQV